MKRLQLLAAALVVFAAVPAGAQNALRVEVGGQWDWAPRASIRPFLSALVGATRIGAPGSSAAGLCGGSGCTIGFSGWGGAPGRPQRRRPHRFLNGSRPRKGTMGNVNQAE